MSPVPPICGQDFVVFALLGPPFSVSHLVRVSFPNGLFILVTRSPILLDSARPPPRTKITLSFRYFRHLQKHPRCIRILSLATIFLTYHNRYIAHAWWHLNPYNHSVHSFNINLPSTFPKSQSIWFDTASHAFLQSLQLFPSAHSVSMWYSRHLVSLRFTNSSNLLILVLRALDSIKLLYPSTTSQPPKLAFWSQIWPLWSVSSTDINLVTCTKLCFLSFFNVRHFPCSQYFCCQYASHVNCYIVLSEWWYTVILDHLSFLETMLHVQPNCCCDTHTHQTIPNRHTSIYHGHLTSFQFSVDPDDFNTGQFMTEQFSAHLRHQSFSFLSHLLPTIE